MDRNVMKTATVQEVMRQQEATVGVLFTCAMIYVTENLIRKLSDIDQARLQQLFSS